MKQLFNLAIFTKKELMQLLIDEKRSSYRKGYKAGAAMRYRHTEKPKTPVEGPIQPAWGWPPPSQTPLEVNDFPAPPAVYGDSLPVKESLTSEK
jgi:hypothetical protein